MDKTTANSYEYNRIHMIPLGGVILWGRARPSQKLYAIRHCIFYVVIVMQLLGSSTLDNKKRAHDFTMVKRAQVPSRQPLRLHCYPRVGPHSLTWRRIAFNPLELVESPALWVIARDVRKKTRKLRWYSHQRAWITHESPTPLETTNREKINLV